MGFPLTLSRQRLDYQRGTVDTTIVRRTIPVNVWDCFIQYTTINPETGRAQKLHLQYIAQTKTPDLVNLVDMRDDADPLNIHLGNHNLHNAISHQFSFSHSFGNQNSREAQSEYYLHYNIVQNALAMTSQYDSNTGIRTWQADNVNGNYDYGADYIFNTAIGKKRPLRLHIRPGINYSHSVDLVNNQRSIVNTLALNNSLTLSYKIGEHSLNFKSTTLWQRFTSPNGQNAAIMSQPLTLTNALTALDVYFHPNYTVTYIVNDENGQELFRSEPTGVTMGANITTLPTAYQKSLFYTYNTVDVTISQAQTDITFTATQKEDGPFKFTADTSAPIWYNLTLKNDCYPTFEDGGEPNVTLPGYMEDNETTQWAFIGSPYAGFKIVNKAAGTDKFLCSDSAVEDGANGGNTQAVLEEDGLCFDLDLVDKDLEFFYTFIHFK